MSYRDLRAFLAGLEASGELHRVEAEVDGRLEIAAVTDRQSKLPAGGKALLFAKVKGSRYAAATNLFGSPARMAAALGVGELGSLTGRMEQLLARPESAPLPVWIDQAPCQEVVQKAPDLGSYPFIMSWPRDGGRFITLPMVFTRDPDTGATNCGMYRVRIFDDNRAGIRWKRGSGAFEHYQKHAERQARMPVAIALGGPPSLTLAAALPLPEPFEELSYAGWLLGEPIEMVRCLTSELSVPAQAELVIEGHIEPGETRPEGRFGNHTGSYDQGEDVPVLTVTCITHRPDPICPATVVGPPPMEDCYMAKAAERLLLPLSRRQCPEIVELNMPMEGIFHGCAVISIEKRFPGQGRKVLETLRRSGWLRKGKLLVVVDAGNEATLSRAFWRAINAVRFPDDLVIADGCLGIDATRKLPEEGGGAIEELKQDQAVGDLVERRWREYGFDS